MNKIHFIDNLKTITQSKIFKLLNEIKDTVGNSIQIRKSIGGHKSVNCNPLITKLTFS